MWVRHFGRLLQESSIPDIRWSKDGRTLILKEGENVIEGFQKLGLNMQKRQSLNRALRVSSERHHAERCFQRY